MAAEPEQADAQAALRERRAALRSLLGGQEIASLGTLHKGEPAVSMVPFAVRPGGRELIIHVSRLATHTADMLAHPGVSLMVHGVPSESVPAQAVPRVTVQGEARPLAHESADYAGAKAVYVGRFPQSEDLFGFGDFSIFLIAVRSARLVGGFGRAASLTAEAFVAMLGANGADDGG